jgi:signal transduction histidine kinase
MVEFLRKTQLGSWLNERLNIDLMGVVPHRVEQELNQLQMGNLPFLSSSIALLFVVYAIAQSFLLKEAHSTLLSIIALMSAGLVMGVQQISMRRLLAERWAEPLVGGVTALVLISMLLRMALNSAPKQTANLILFLVAIGALFLSSRWFLSLFFSTFLGWVIAVLLLPEHRTDWGFYGVVMSAAGATAVIIHIIRLYSYRRIIVLRIREEEQRVALEQRTLQLKTSADVGSHITSILDLEQLLQQVAELIRVRYGLQYVGVYLPQSSDQAHISVVAEAGQSNGRLPAETYTRQAMANGRSLRINDFKQQEVNHDEDVQSLLLLPLKMGNKLLGLLDLQSQQTGAFHEEDVPNFQLLADQVAIALNNAHLYDQTRQFNQQLEIKVQERTAELQNANVKLERLDITKTDFITIASHELRTPLTLMNFYAQMFLEDEQIQQNELFAKWAGGINQGVNRIEEVVGLMLDVAKIDSMSLDLYPGPLNLSFLLLSVRGKFKAALAERHISFVIEQIADLPEIEADVEAIEKVFYHLFVNAIKYTPDGGEIEVNGRLLPDKPQIEITIADSGIGIDPEVHNLIFEKFYQTGEVMLHSSGKTSFKGGGAGLGLAIARGIIEAHHGKIWVESAGYSEETFPGSIFHVVLPQHQPKA